MPGDPGNLMSEIDRPEDSSRMHQQRSLALFPDAPQGSPHASYAMEPGELQRLPSELDRLRNENHALQTALLASTERGVLLQEQVDRLDTRLTADQVANAAKYKGWFRWKPATEASVQG